MRSRSLLALAPLILVVELALAQTCPCTQQTDATCEVLELSGPGTCSSSAFTCNKCLCVTEGLGTSTCDVESAQALVFTGSGSECALQSVSYAKCPEVAAVGWTAAADNGQHCDRACTAVNGTCNVDRLIALNDLGGVDNTAFAAVFSEVGLTCRFFVDDPNLGAPLYYSGGCGYSSSKTPVCGAALAYGSSVRVCCCGADEDCPI
uniref:Uncharacterized protein n=1 Tax=Erythrolobus australicus TaxID=1077150 RepID=A0A7S1XIX0_9RHOD|mmetsp:Transcript_3450/g.9434  ORF Transcript_3450/g.9434 Transcript_3450/m.9434 type:complete len:206 (+) Transcript_3450:135-752(+)